MFEILQFLVGLQEGYRQEALYNCHGGLGMGFLLCRVMATLPFEGVFTFFGPDTYTRTHTHGYFKFHDIVY